jgi:hypothetical protein
MCIWKTNKVLFDRYARKVAENVRYPENRRPECDLSAELRGRKDPFKATVPQTSQSLSY